MPDSIGALLGLRITGTLVDPAVLAAIAVVVVVVVGIKFVVPYLDEAAHRLTNGPSSESLAALRTIRRKVAAFRKFANAKEAPLRVVLACPPSQLQDWSLAISRVSEEDGLLDASQSTSVVAEELGAVYVAVGFATGSEDADDIGIASDSEFEAAEVAARGDFDVFEMDNFTKSRRPYDLL